jgi:hypothetical protein
LRIAMVIRVNGVGPHCPECSLDLAHLDFLWKLTEVAAAGGDPRDALYGPESARRLTRLAHEERLSCPHIAAPTLATPDRTPSSCSWDSSSSSDGCYRSSSITGKYGTRVPTEALMYRAFLPVLFGSAPIAPERRTCS